MTGTGSGFRSDRLKERREALGLTQTELAERVDVSLNSVYKYETEQAEPNSGTLAKLADALGVSADWLLGRTDELSGIFAEGFSEREYRLMAEIRRHDPSESMRALLDFLAEQK